MRLIHNSRLSQFRTPFGAVTTGTSVSLSVILEDADPNQATLTLRTWVDEIGESLYPMTHEGDGIFTVELECTEPCLIWYSFICNIEGQPVVRLGAPQGRTGGEGVTYNYAEVPSFQITVYKHREVRPEWYERGMVYQIFPDRYARDENWRERTQTEVEKPRNGIQRRMVEDWNEPPEYKRAEDGSIKTWDFYGGSLKGIQNDLPRIAELGFTAIYLNPIFEAASNHRYDTACYERIDPLLGDEADFRTLCAEAKKRGIYVMLDGVFNHTGRKSVYFNADGFYDELGAAQGEQSPYYRWYSFHPFPDEYDAWWGIKNLPAVNELEKSYVDYIIEGDHSIIKHWLRAGASGWRLDVADELPDEFIAKIRAAMNEENPDTYLLGEVWEDGTTKIAYSQRRKYLLGRETNGLMNYPFRTALMAYLLGGGAEYFRDSMEELRENYPAPAFYGAMNFLSTHDTPRLLTILGLTSPAPQTRDERAVYQLSDSDLARGMSLLKLAALILYTFPGSPMLYYGDEAGMQGFEDPFNRGTYPWGRENAELVQYFQQLGALRKSHEALQSGTIVYHAAQGRALAFSRRTEHDHCLTAVNAGDEPVTLTLPWDGTLAEDALSHQEFFCGNGLLRLTLEPYGTMLLTQPQE